MQISFGPSEFVRRARPRFYPASNDRYGRLVANFAHQADRARHTFATLFGGRRGRETRGAWYAEDEQGFIDEKALFGTPHVDPLDVATHRNALRNLTDNFLVGTDQDAVGADVDKKFRLVYRSHLSV